MVLEIMRCIGKTPRPKVNLRPSAELAVMGGTQTAKSIGAN
jgi:hypothetical protein